MKNSLKERAKTLNAQIPAVFLAMKDGRTPWYAKVMAALTVIYALSPIDLIPDVIPVLGCLDDLIILPGLVVMTIRCVPKSVWEENLEKATDMWQEGKPKKWYYGIPFAILWVLLIVLILKAIL